MYGLMGWRLALASTASVGAWAYRPSTEKEAARRYGRSIMTTPLLSYSAAPPSSGTASLAARGPPTLESKDRKPGQEQSGGCIPAVGGCAGARSARHFGGRAGHRRAALDLG